MPTLSKRPRADRARSTLLRRSLTWLILLSSCSELCGTTDQVTLLSEGEPCDPAQQYVSQICWDPLTCCPTEAGAEPICARRSRCWLSQLGEPCWREIGCRGDLTCWEGRCRCRPSCSTPCIIDEASCEYVCCQAPEICVDGACGCGFESLCTAEGETLCVIDESGCEAECCAEDEICCDGHCFPVPDCEGEAHPCRDAPNCRYNCCEPAQACCEGICCSEGAPCCDGVCCEPDQGCLFGSECRSCRFGCDDAILLEGAEAEVTVVWDEWSDTMTSFCAADCPDREGEDALFALLVPSGETLVVELAEGDTDGSVLILDRCPPTRCLDVIVSPSERAASWTNATDEDLWISVVVESQGFEDLEETTVRFRVSL